MRYRGSYLNGLAPRDFRPSYPELWKGCVGAWCPSLGPTGAVLRDWSGKQHHGTLPATSWSLAPSAGGAGYALTLDGGAGNYVNCGQIDDVDFGTGNFTVSFWARWTATGTRNMVFKSDSAGVDLGLYIYQETSNVGKISYWNGSADTFNGSGLNDGAWHHVLFRRTGTGAGLVQAVIDGAVGANAITDSRTLSAAKSLVLGASSDGNNRFAGYMDDVRVYSRALSLSESLLLYSGGRGRGIAYSFNQPRGSLTPGESSGSSGGTFPGLAWRALRKWRFVVRAGVDGNWPRVT